MQSIRCPVCLCVIPTWQGHTPTCIAAMIQDAAPRHELGKFFVASAAEAHAELIRSQGRGWRDVQVEKRTETRRSQHPAHGGDLPPLAK